jgi:hypothetical protein
LTGHMSFGIDATGQSWDTQSWGNVLGLANAVGSATEDSTQNVTISLQGQMAGSTSDAVVLRNFTVIRYPAQTNP